MPLGLNTMIVGTEWLIEAHGCDSEALRDETLLRETFARVMDELGLKAIGAVWHKFPGEGGVTGMIALTESHLSCHTYPEHGIATFNLYCCRRRPEWDWDANLKGTLGAGGVKIMKIERGSEEAEISNLEFEISNLKSRNSNLKSQIANLDSQNSNLKSQIANLNSQNANLRSQISNLEFQLSDLSSEIDHKTPDQNIPDQKIQIAGGDH
jgi:S-adenosylmethionine decarboxylase